MIWLLLAVAAVIALLCWLGYTDAVTSVLGNVLAVYVVLEKGLLKVTEKIAKKWDEQKRKSFLTKALLLEVIVVVISFFVSADKVQWSYKIMACTPGGGVLSFVLDRKGFFALGSFSVWILSGFQFLLQSSYDQEVAKVYENKFGKLLIFSHSVLFSFFTGAVLALLVDFILLPYVGVLDMGIGASSVVLKLICMVLKLLYYAIGLFFLVLTVQVFLDNVRVLSVVLFAYGMVYLLYRVIVWALLGNTGNAVTAATLKGMALLIYHVEQLQTTHPVIWGLLLTFGAMLVYNIGVVYLGNAVKNAKGAIEDFQRSSHDIRMDTVLRVSKMSDLQRYVLKKTNESDYETYLEYKDSSDYRDYLERIQAEKEQVKRSLEESSDLLREILLQDEEKGMIGGKMRKMMRMKPEKLIKKYKITSRDIDQAEREVFDYEFTKARIEAVEHNDVSMNFAFLACMAFWGVSLMAVFLSTYVFRSDSNIVSDISVYLGIAELWSILFSAVVKVFRRDRSIPLRETKAFYGIWAVSALLTYLTGTQLYKLGFLDSLSEFPILSFLVACLATAAVRNILLLPVVRRCFSDIRGLQKSAIKGQYRLLQMGYSGKHELEKLDRHHQVLYVVIFARAEELRKEFA